jgi:hypothetical protein
MSEESSENGPWFAVGAVLGAAIGLTVGLLAAGRDAAPAGRAPAPPPETRQPATEPAESLAGHELGDQA